MHTLILGLLFLCYLDVLAIPSSYSTNLNQDNSHHSPHSIRDPNELMHLESRVAVPPQPPPYYPIVYHVPNTRMVITAHIHQRVIDADVLGGTIRQIQHNIQERITSEGDGPLPPTWDPFVADFGWGCYILVESSDKLGPGGVKQRLTWSQLRSAFAGLFYIACRLGHPYEMKFEMMVVDLGTVGMGHIDLGSLNGPVDSTHAWMNNTSIADT